MSRNIIPADSRYAPFTQQPYCCVPACLQTIMYKHDLPLGAQEEIGYYLGLSVPKNEQHMFWHVRSSKEPPPAGWGTQISKPGYSPNAALKKLGVPLRMTLQLIDKFDTSEAVRIYLKQIEQTNKDVIVCFKYGILHDLPSGNGHANVFDRYLAGTDEVRLIDPEYKVPKWRVVKLDKLFKAMKEHGPDKSGGFWEIERIDQ